MVKPHASATSSVAESPHSDWHTQSAEEVLSRTGASPLGLSASESAQRLAASGPNELQEGKREGSLHMLLNQFKSVVIWILVGAGIISGLLGELVDTIAIFAIVALNAGIGFYQELKAERSLDALKKLTAPQAKVRRDGQLQLVPAASVVVGDVLVLEAGDVVAADARVLVVASLQCIEAALTGESEAVTKSAAALPAADVPLGDRENMVFQATSVAAGTGQAVVVATGMQTELGRIASLIDEASAESSTPLQRKLDAVGRVLVWAALGIVALLFGLGWLRGTNALELTMTALSLAVAAVPEGLPAVVTVALSVGVLRMARRRALVRKLAAVETLGSTSVICTDKTGTLTVGEMTVRAICVADRSYEVTGEGYGPEGEVRFEGEQVKPSDAAPLRELATILLGCNDAQLVQVDGRFQTVGDPTEGALLAAGAKAGGDRRQLEQQWPMVQTFPFDSDRKRSSVIRRMPDGRLRALINGAPGLLLERCSHVYTGSGIGPLTEEGRERQLGHASAMAKQALRVLGSAYRDLADPVQPDATADSIERDLVFVGLTGMYDPPRGEAKAAVARCRAAGIRVVMITGDHPDTAAAIARELGVAADAPAMRGAALDKMTPEELQRSVVDVDVYARVTAAHKLRIVRALKANQAVVAMTGDGVNDAPAIKGADIGIAMGISGTQVTKQAADMIITDDNFATIVAAVEEGRGIYDNIQKTLQYLLAGSTGELLLMTVCVVMGLPTPLLPIHLLWINLVTDGLPALCLATDPIDTDVMRRKPRLRSERLMNRAFLRTMLITGFLTASVSFAAYVYVLRGGSVASARGAAFAVLVFAELLRAFGARSDSKNVWSMPLFANAKLLFVVAGSLGLQVLSQHNAALGSFLRTPFMSFVDCAVLLALGAIPLAVLEILKLASRRRASDRATAGLLLL
ncbi:MAG TPA: cation-translocating P-type ATPase [Polyangiaceae bacterium]|nr:cation-translocating P-type ATPase [Polyangiaceae bacterium]